MKRSASTTRHRPRGFAAMPMVTFFGVFLLLSLAMVYRGTIIKRDQAAKSQLKIDYHQREEALMRAIVASFPSKVVACLKGNYAASSDYDWNAVFQDAIAQAGADVALSAALKTSLGLTGVRQADVGDDTGATVLGWITDLEGNTGKVTPGTTTYSDVFLDPLFANKVPPLLKAPTGLETADENRPIVSPEKIYVNQAGLGANVANYPKFNQIPYPNIRFGYAAAGAPFVAKRNWWAFSVKYGQGTGLTKNYVLSLYEIPSQLPIEAATFAEIGKHANGASWSNVTIQGGIYAESLKMNDSYGAERLAGRESIELMKSLTLDGTSVSQDFDAMGQREQMQASARTNILPIALSANSGRVVFYPIPSGTAFLNKPVGATTKWDEYKSGGIDCKMEVEAIAMVGLENQTPTSIRVRFATAAGGQKTVILTRGSSWPANVDPGGDLVPFQTELTNNNRSCLTFYPSRLNAWLASQGGASVETNNSVHFTVDATADPLTVLPLSSPPSVNDMSVIIRGGRNLTSFTKGLSMVAPLRIYIGDDLNDIPMPAVPSDPSIPATMTAFYPPMSIFAAELRVGTTAFNRPFSHSGQMGSLQSGGTTAWLPMDVKSGTDDTVWNGQISASLTPIQSPVELPPIHQLNWLVVVEEIPQN